MTFFEHSDAEAQRLTAIPVAGDHATRGIVSGVATRWESTYLWLSQLYSMWPRLSVYVRSAALTPTQRRRRVSHRDSDKIRHLIAILTPIYEVTKACQSTSATLSDIFVMIFALRKTLLMDGIVTPKVPEHTLAGGAEAIASCLLENPDKDVSELDNRLYPCEAVYMAERDDAEALCNEAVVAVRIVGTEIDRMFFNRKDDTKNWLKNPGVLGEVLLSPGGGRMLREVGDWVGTGGPAAATEAAVLQTAAKLRPDSSVPVGSTPTGTTRRTDGISELRMTARSSLVLWQAEQPVLREPPVEAHGPHRVAREELALFRRLSEGAAAGDALSFRRAHQTQLSCPFLVAASSFGAAGSSASCERECSIAGRPASSNRSSLTVRSVEMHSLVAANADLVPTHTSLVPFLSHEEAATFRQIMSAFVPYVADAELEVYDSYTDEDKSEEDFNGPFRGTLALSQSCCSFFFLF